MDSIPMVIISGQVPSPVIGSDAFQEVDMVGITRPCVKHNFLSEKRCRFSGNAEKSVLCRHNRSTRPVVVDIPKDITDPNIKIPYKYPKKITMRSYNPAVVKDMQRPD
jgi:acetolactate synthase I/II/III large subunit